MLAFTDDDRVRLVSCNGFRVAVHILEGAFTLEMEGRAPLTVKAGEALVEPANAKIPFSL
jgi:hypothetical protein